MATTEETELFSKVLDIKLTAKNSGSIHDTLSRALLVVKAYGHSAYLEFPKGYSIRIWPDSSLTDLKRIEELENTVWHLKNNPQP